MQFADPAWEPKVTREFEAIMPPSAPELHPASADVTASSQAAETDLTDYAQGYRPHNTSIPEQANPSQNQAPPPPFPGQSPPFQSQQPPLTSQSQSLQDLLKRLPAWAWWVVGIIFLSSFMQSVTSEGGLAGGLVTLLLFGLLAFSGWLLYTRRVRISLSGEAQAAETHTFVVGAQPTVVLKNKTGSIKLRSGQQGQVSITTTRRGYLFSPRLDRETQITYNQDSTTNTVTARAGSWRPFGKNAINFEVVVPPEADLQIATNFGIISVENVAGQINLKSDAGTIQATGVTLRGKSRLKSDVGTITFSGSLDPAGNYELTTDLGTINVTLAPNASCNLQAKTDLGTVTTNLPLAKPQHNKAYGVVGNGPYPELKVKTDLGSITIQRP